MLDTIAAIATGDQISAIGIIRISGPEALSVIAHVFTEGGKRPASSFEPRKLYYGTLTDMEGNVLDHCLCTISRAPHSYTGEDTAELQCHGSPVLLQSALAAIHRAGARQARAGEFTKRAFLNGKLDLVQAEAVIDLIHAESAQAAKNAAGQLGGTMSRKTDAVYDGLRDILAHFHAELDYPDEDIEPFYLPEYRQSMAQYAADLEVLLATCRRGQIMTRGVKTAILGLPNVGKSSLLNALLGYERAIVTDIPGTTRDTLEERVLMGDALLRLTDTAGVRDTVDEVEQEGVVRSMLAAQEAELVLAVLDGTRPLEAGDLQVLEMAKQAPYAIAVISKTDLPQQIDETPIKAQFDCVVHLSAKTGTGLSDLETVVSELFATAPIEAGHTLTNPRHVEAAERAHAHLISAISATDAGITPDAVLTELEGAMTALGELTGRSLREDVVGRIFERFCVGK